jgi:site-specific recombinase XerD
MFKLGHQATPAKVQRMPAFPHLKENNVRKGFLDDSQYRKLVEGTELWFRALVECGRTYGWRVSELLNLSVSEVDLAQCVIRLEPGTTKNTDGREVFMTDTVHAMLTACVAVRALKITSSLARMESRFAVSEGRGRRSAPALAWDSLSAAIADRRHRTQRRVRSAVTRERAMRA